MKVLEVFSLLTFAATLWFSYQVAFGQGGFAFGDPITTMLVATTMLFAWAAVTLALVVNPLLAAEPQSMLMEEEQSYSIAFATPGVAGFLLALAFGIKFWTSAYGPIFPGTVTVLVIASAALVSVSASITNRLRKPEVVSEATTS